MHRRSGVFLLLFFIVAISNPSSGLACDVCGCPFNAKRSEGKSAVGSTITTPTANTMGARHGFAGFLFEQQRYDSMAASHAHSLHHPGRDIHDKTHEEFYNLVGGLGVLQDLDLYAELPIVSRSSLQIEDHARLGQRDTSSGVGDLRVGGKYRFWKKGVDAALLFGVKAPTGQTSNINKSGDKIEPELQPGSGSWDVTGGLSASRSFQDRWTLASAVQYTYRGEGAQDEKLGDVFRYDLGFSYALKPLGRNPNVSLVAEFQLQWLGKDRSRGVDKVLDSGGTTLFFSPGISADLTKSLSAFVAVPVPIHQNLGGEHVEVKYEVLTGLSWHF